MLHILMALCLGWLVSVVVSSSTQPAAAAWQEEWEKTLQLARKEGKVVIKGPPGAEVRRALTSPFEKAFPGISVELEGGQGGELAAKLIRERGANLYTSDVWIGGLGTQLSLLKPKGVQDPVEPALILPEVKDTKYWRDNQHEFADKEGKYALVFVNQAGTVLAYNTQLLKPNDVPQSLKDLLDPKWKGKIISTEPTDTGPGRAHYTWMYKTVGPDYIRALGKQQITFTRSRRDLADQVGRGAFPLAIAVSILDAQPFIDAGAPLKVMWEVKEGSYASASYGAVALVNRAPHPNAAKVYINWVLGKEGQQLFAKAANWNSRRVDLPPEDPAGALKPGVKYFKIYTEEASFIYQTKEYASLMKEVFGTGR